MTLVTMLPIQKVGDYRYKINTVLPLLLVLMVVTFVMHASSSFGRDVPESFADLADRLSPLVVNITTTTMVKNSQQNFPQFPDGSPFRRMFPDFFDDFFNNPRGRQPERKSSGLGSGFIISADGFVVTNNHVIDNVDKIMVEFFDGTKLPATLIGRDEKTDIALLQVDVDEPLPFVTFANSDIGRVGDWVIAIGNPLGQGFTVTSGIISARNRSLQGTYDDFIQTDAAINRGNSGGPLFNMQGEVIGVNTAIISPSGGSIGIGFAMSSNVVRKVVNQLQQYGETRRGWLGVQIQDLDADSIDALGLNSANGALISVVPPGPSADAGILAGDVIVSFDGKPIKNTRQLIAIVGDADIGKTVEVMVYRNNEVKKIMVVLGRREDAERSSVLPATITTPEQNKTEQLGMVLSNLTPEIREKAQINNNVSGVFVNSVDQATKAFDKGIRAGDLIRKVGGQSIASLQDMQQILHRAKNDNRRSILLLVESRGVTRFVALPLG